MKRALFALLSVLPITMGSAMAQGFSIKNLELSLSEGGSYFSGKNFRIGSPQSSTAIDGQMKFSANNRHEGRLNFLTTNRIGVEAFYAYEATAVVFSRITAPADSLSIPLQIHHFGIDVLYYPVGTTESKWRPFIRVGGGAAIYRPTGAGQSIATDPLRGNFSTFIESSRSAIDFGGGLKRSLTRSLGVRLDAGSLITPSPTFGLPVSSDLANASVLPVTGRTRNLHASVGIILYLGK
jgi:hypothetical protein